MLALVRDEVWPAPVEYIYVIIRGLGKEGLARGVR